MQELFRATSGGELRRSMSLQLGRQKGHTFSEEGVMSSRQIFRRCNQPACYRAKILVTENSSDPK